MNASHVANFNAARKENSEHPSYNKLMLAFAAEMTERSADDTYAASRTYLLATNPLDVIIHEWFHTPIVMPFIINEIFASRLSKAVGVNVPEVLPATGIPIDWSLPDPPVDYNTLYLDAWMGFGEAAYDPPREGLGVLTEEFYVKPLSSGWALVRRVPRAIPIYFLREKTPTAPPWVCQSDFDDLERPDYLLNKRSPVERGAFADFPPEAESDQEVLAQARWDSEPRLYSYAFRAWLWCTFPHASNTLVTAGGDTWVVDHEKTLFRKDCDDIEELAKVVAGSERVMAICRRMSAITGDHIAEALRGIPKKFWQSGEGVLTDEDKAVNYFCRRAEKWRGCFGVEAKRTAGFRPGL